MQVRLLFGQRKEQYPGEYAPELMEAWDEYTLDDNWEGWEEAKAAAIASWGDDLVAAREIVINIADDAIDSVFLTPTIEAEIIQEDG